MAVTSELALKLASKGAAFLFGIVFKQAKEIRRIAQRTKGNEVQCRRLSERIELFAATIEGRRLKETADRSAKVVLVYLIIFLEECKQFLEEFAEKKTIRRLWDNKNDCQKFEDLHRTLSHRLEAIQTSELLAKLLVNDDSDQHCQHSDPTVVQILSKLQNTKVNSCDFS